MSGKVPAKKTRRPRFPLSVVPMFVNRRVGIANPFASVMVRDPLPGNPEHVLVTVHAAQTISAMHRLLSVDKIPSEVMDLFLRCRCIIDTADLVKPDFTDPFSVAEKAKLCGFLHMIGLGYTVTDEHKDMYKFLPFADGDFEFFYDEFHPQILPNNTLNVAFCCTYRVDDVYEPTKQDKKVVGGWLDNEATPEERGEFVEKYLGETFKYRENQ